MDGIVGFFSQLLPHFRNALTLGVFPVVLCAALAFLILFGLRRQFQHPPGAITVSVSFAALAAMLGVFIGASRDPVVGATLPSLVTLISGLMLYLFSKKEMSEWRSTIPLAVIALVVSASAGGFYGGQARNIAENNRTALEFQNAISKEYLVRHLGAIETLRDICVSECVRNKQMGEEACYRTCQEQQLERLQRVGGVVSSMSSTALVEGGASQ